MAVYRLGAIGREVEWIQGRLRELNYYLGAIDGIYGGATESAVKRFQRDRALSQDGQVGPITWHTLFSLIAPEAGPTPPSDGSDPPADGPAPLSDVTGVPPVIPAPSVSQKPLATRCLELTGAFETSTPPIGCYRAVSGNFDGQGISFGCLQWNLGQGSLQNLLRRLDALHSNVIPEVFHAHASTIQDVMRMTKAEAVSWARMQQTPKNVLIEPWLGLFKALGSRTECQSVQQEFAQNVFRSALQLCKSYGLTSERAVALMFDIVTQNGSIKPGVRSLIFQDFARIGPSGDPMRDEEKRLVIVANRRSDAAKAKWREDVRTRKLTLANGAGFVHGGRYHLLEGYGIGLLPATEVL